MYYDEVCKNATGVPTSEEAWLRKVRTDLPCFSHFFSFTVDSDNFG